jgi:transcription elongation GreA/GreB family factor
MNAKHLVAALAVLAATGSALAQEFVTPDAGFVSTKTRAEVIAELQQARADGTYAVSEYDYPVVQLTGTPKTRAEVVAEIEKARADGTLNYNEENYPIVKTTGTPKTREQVREELVQYRQAHPFGETESIYFGG